MKVVLVEILSTNDNEKVDATIIVEQKRGEGVRRINAWDVTSGFPEAKRRILLEDDERVVIEGRGGPVKVYDPKQMALVTPAEASTPDKTAPTKTPETLLNRPVPPTNAAKPTATPTPAVGTKSAVPPTNQKLGTPAPGGAASSTQIKQGQ